MDPAKHLIYAETVSLAVDQLHRPHYPDTPGLDTFNSSVPHPDVWDNDIDFSGKHVSIIGTGFGVAQMLPAIASVAAETTVYQRNPFGVHQKPAADLGCVTKSLLQVPIPHKIYRKALHHCADSLLSSVPRSETWRNTVEKFATFSYADKSRMKHLYRT